MFHTVAFAFDPNTMPNRTAGTLSAIQAVQDQYFAASGTFAFLLPQEMKLVAAYANSTFMKSARINSPTLLRVGFPYIRPVQIGLFQPQPVQNPPLAPNDPNVMVLHFNQLAFPTGEPIGVDAVTASNDPIVAMLWFVSGKTTDLPHGDAFWMRYTTVNSDTAAIKGYRWSQLTPTFDQTLPSGTYAVVGFEHVGPNTMGARIIFPGSNHRPGVLVTSAATLNLTSPLTATPGTFANNIIGNRTFHSFYDGSFGTYGHFKTTSPPYVEVLSVAPDTSPGGVPTAASNHEGYMRLIRIGDLNMQMTHGHDLHHGRHPMGGGPAAGTAAVAGQIGTTGGVQPTATGLLSGIMHPGPTRTIR